MNSHEKMQTLDQPENQQITLKDKTVLITGGTHGIGAETALCMAAQGARLCLAARNARTAEIASKLEKMGVDFVLLSADLSKENECYRLVEQAHERFGGIDVLVHSAGSAAPGSLLNGAHKVWYQAFDIHVHAAFHLCRAVVPHMKNRQGAIVLISSAAGLRGVRNALAYAVVKGAIPQFTRALALELSDFDIRVNCVSPGVIRTRFQDHLSNEQVKNNIENRIPLHREGTAADVAEVICMLVKNRFITGENFVIDGGMTMRIV